MLLPLIFLPALLTALLILKYVLMHFSFWKNQNVPCVDIKKSFFNFRKSIIKPLHESELDWYKRYGRVYGRYEGINPVLSVGDPDMLKQIFVKDFHIFPNRRDMRFNDPIMDNTLFILEGDAWKRVRNIVTPTFTTAKLKRMLSLLSECCDMLIEKFEVSAEKSETINCQQNFAGFVLNAIGRCAFGMSINDLRKPNNQFIEKATKLFECTLSWRTYLTMFFPSLMKIFRMKLLNPETTEFYRKTIIQVLEERKRLHLVQDDFLQMLLDAENGSADSNNNGATTTKEDAIYTHPALHTHLKPTEKALSHDEMLSQCITFFIAGFDSTTSLLSNIFYHLATIPKYQEILLEEIREALSNTDGVLNYEALSEMKFMDAVLNECLRMCPSMVRSERRAEEDYTFEKGNISVKKGMLVSIPVYAIHHDPAFYPQPHQFKPERFYCSEPCRSQYVHLPFGAGPRVCVGMRFAQMQVKLCLAKLLLAFQVMPAPSTPASLGYIESRGILRVADVDICLKKRIHS